MCTPCNPIPLARGAIYHTHLVCVSIWADTRHYHCHQAGDQPQISGLTANNPARLHSTAHTLTLLQYYRARLRSAVVAA
jgi:hypothetical protein